MTAASPTVLSLALLATCALAPSAAAQTTHYVDAGLTTGANDGSSWADAFQGSLALQAALSSATSGDEVWVAQGSYQPAGPGGARTISFQLASGVTLRGGFMGGEATLIDRPAFGVAPSVLSGDLDGDDGPGFTNQDDNSYHVVDASGVDATAVLEGFTITAGASTGSGTNEDRGGGLLALAGAAPTILDCVFARNQASVGGGAAHVNGSALFARCTFQENDGGGSGGALNVASAGQVFVQQSSFMENQALEGGAVHVFATLTAEFTNCLFKGNLATGLDGGGAMLFSGVSGGLVANCTILENEAMLQAQGGIRMQSAFTTVVNSVLADNVGINGSTFGFNQVTPGASLDYCLVTGGFFSGVGNISAAPTFVDAAGGDYRLAPGSAGIDAGDTTAVAGTLTVDLAGRTRLRDDPATPDAGVTSGGLPVVDMGAFENQAGAVGVSFCPNTSNSQNVAAELSGMGSDVAADNDVTLTASGLPPNQFGLLAVSRSSAVIPMAGGSQGTLCLGGAIGRYNGQVTSSGPAGTFDLALDLTSIPAPTGPTAAVAGDTWVFQVWYRDVVLGFPVSNFTSALSIRFK